MSCRKCGNKRCNCKIINPGTLPPPCTKPSCISKHKCLDTINIECVVLNTGYVLNSQCGNIYVPAGTNYDSFIQQQMLAQSNCQCLANGGASQSTKWIYVEFNNGINVYWDLVNNSDLNPNYQVCRYDVVIKQLSTGNTYKFQLANNISYYNVIPVGTMTYNSGEEYEVWVETVTAPCFGNLPCTCLNNEFNEEDEVVKCQSIHKYIKIK